MTENNANIGKYIDACKYIGSSLFLLYTLVACSQPNHPNVTQCLHSDQIGEFVTLPGGQFTKSAKPVYPEEGQPHPVAVKSFNLQTHEVTNQQFADFITATNYITDSERSQIEQRDGAGSALFTRGSSGDEGEWTLIDTLNWRTPDGPNSDLANLGRHPVVHVSFNDALSYAQWAGGRLPTEIEWEYAASLGIEDINNSFAGAYDDKGTPVANTWQGIFPIIDSGKDGYKGTAPAGCYAANNIGLYDMIGNVWEWTSTPYDEQRHTIKGGSHLCANNFCRRYRPEARQPMESNFSSNHIGFRIVKDVNALPQPH